MLTMVEGGHLEAVPSGLKADVLKHLVIKDLNKRSKVICNVQYRDEVWWQYFYNSKESLRHHTDVLKSHSKPADLKVSAGVSFTEGGSVCNLIWLADSDGKRNASFPQIFRDPIQILVSKLMHLKSKWQHFYFWVIHPLNMLNPAQNTDFSPPGHTAAYKLVYSEVLKPVLIRHGWFRLA